MDEFEDYTADTTDTSYTDTTDTSYSDTADSECDEFLESLSSDQLYELRDALTATDTADTDCEFKFDDLPSDIDQFSDADAVNADFPDIPTISDIELDVGDREEAALDTMLDSAANTYTLDNPRQAELEEMLDDLPASDDDPGKPPYVYIKKR